MLRAILLGNTTIRRADIEGDAIIRVRSLPLPPAGVRLPDGWLAEAGPAGEAVIGSVHPPRLAEVLEALEAAGTRAVVAGRDIPVPIPNRYSDPRQTGIDRLLNAYAATRLLPGRGCVVLDFGTALSVSIVSPAGEFLGGPIAPGMRAAAIGLASATAQLPGPPEGRPLMSSSPPLAATSTEAALAAGVWCAVAGAASRIIGGLAGELAFPFTVIATGGDASLFASELPAVDRVDPDLALRGLAWCHAAAGR
jgi:type III pantothenate kinase